MFLIAHACSLVSAGYSRVIVPNIHLMIKLYRGQRGSKFQASKRSITSYTLIIFSCPDPESKQQDVCP